jgi:hypothetical protein
VDRRGLGDAALLVGDGQHPSHLVDDRHPMWTSPAAVGETIDACGLPYQRSVRPSTPVDFPSSGRRDHRRLNTVVLGGDPLAGWAHIDVSDRRDHLAVTASWPAA